MKFFKSSGLFISILLTLFVSASLADTVSFGTEKQNGKQIFWLSNDQVKCSISYEEGKLLSDSLEAQPDWLLKYGTPPFVVETDADFGLDIMWTGWRAPGNVNNAENPITLTKNEFELLRHEVREMAGEDKELSFLLKGKNNSLEVFLTYQLENEAFFARRKVAVRDTRSGRHFLRWLWPRHGLVSGDVSVLKPGGFGQPVAFLYKEGGAFFGLEYPTSENYFQPVNKKVANIRCGQEIGDHIGDSWIESEWVVSGLSPNSHVKLWFWKYLETIRVAPLKPYLLYNTWYDVRAPEIVKSPAHIMNEENVLGIIESFRKEMVEKRGLRLDAFVLDDGWDTYKSDWLLSKEQFPRGLSPVASALKGIGTNPGIWFGPIGGYSNRSWRIEWMRDHGYEVIGTKVYRGGEWVDRGQLCLAGKQYKELFKKRVVDFVRSHGVGYYKWDGIQFSCSEPDHGHPVGIYSRRSVMESLIDLCRSVRAENPDIFLNITSGTWLSPWWLKYTNTIWMQGRDYGYSNVPSISRRDGAITYRDYVLFEDFGKNNFWFPISNLMTHGIIKGNLQKLGGEAEPLDKFTDNALLYFARGVSMWELYISPDLLTDGEWDALAKSIRWAKDRFDILQRTEMVGGDPGKSQAYGYVHLKGKHGIIAARNPSIEPQDLKVELLPSMGLDLNASNLVVERVYPTRWVAPKLYEADSDLDISLQGYETAIYEIYPLNEASRPLLAGVTYELVKEDNKNYILRLYDAEKETRVLNPEKISSLKIRGRKMKPNELSVPEIHIEEPVSNGSVRLSPQDRQSEIHIEFDLHKPAKGAMLAVLLDPTQKGQDENDPEVTAFLDGNKVEADIEQQKGRWGWYRFDVTPGKHTSRVIITPPENMQKWSGQVSVWLICSLSPEPIEISFDLVQKLGSRRPMPPQPWAAGEIRRNVKLGEVKIF